MKIYDKKKCKDYTVTQLVKAHIENHNELDFIMDLLDVVRQDMIDLYSKTLNAVRPEEATS